MIIVTTVEINDMYRGTVLQGDSILLLTDDYKSERRAKREAYVMFHKALYECCHEWEEQGEYSEENEQGGIDYVHEKCCKKCSLSHYTVNDRSIYESYFDG
jgi:hypothetical protein